MGGVTMHGGTDGGPKPRYDFSSNANALGPNPEILAQVARADLGSYPDPSYRALRGRLAEWHEVGAERVVVGAGGSELIHRLVRVFGGPVLALEPTFGEYALAARVVSVAYIGASSRREFLAYLPRATVAFLAQPNNPTGELYDAAFLEEALRLARVHGARLVLDLAYAPLAEVDAPIPTNACLLYVPNKAHGLTGIRAAYLIAASPLTASYVAAATPSWVVGGTGVAFLRSHMNQKAREWLLQTKPKLLIWRRMLAYELSKRGYEVREGAANFLMARLGRGVYAELRRAGIKVRWLVDKGLIEWSRLSAQPPRALAAFLNEIDFVRYHRV